jgi:hypothetical protein
MERCCHIFVLPQASGTLLPVKMQHRAISAMGRQGIMKQ